MGEGCQVATGVLINSDNRVNIRGVQEFTSAVISWCTLEFSKEAMRRIDIVKKPNIRHSFIINQVNNKVKSN